MDDRYADDEYRSSYPEGGYPTGEYAEGPYPAGDYASGEYPTSGYDHPSGEYPAEYAEDYPAAYGYDDTPPPEPVRERTPRPKIEPIDEDGVRAIEIGTILWLVGFVALLPFWGPLASRGLTWWIWTCLAGFGLGAIGIEITRRRRARRQSRR